MTLASRLIFGLLFLLHQHATCAAPTRPDVLLDTHRDAAPPSQHSLDAEARITSLPSTTTASPFDRYSYQPFSPEQFSSHDHHDPTLGSTPIEPSSSFSSSPHLGSAVPIDPYPDCWSPLPTFSDHEYDRDSHHEQVFHDLLLVDLERDQHRPWSSAKISAALHRLPGSDLSRQEEPRPELD